MNWLNELYREILFLPPQSSSYARSIDTLHYIVITTTFVGAIGITIIGGWFLIRYRRGRGVEPPRQVDAPRTPGWLEAIFVLGLFGLFIIFWFAGAIEYARLRIAPANAMPIYVTAKQWMWKFAYPEGAHSISALYVPAGRPVKLIMTARDVIHSFYVPDFRVKQDVVPGRYTTLWFEAPEPGVHTIFCAEYCGTGHSTMRGEVIVLSPADYARWLRGAPALQPPIAGPQYQPPATVDEFKAKEGVNLVEQGRRAAADHGCLRCHTLDGSPYIAPTWAGLYKSQVKLDNGQTIEADEAYLTESMMDPAKKHVAGFPLVMPSYLGRLEPADTAAILELIRSIRDVPPIRTEPPPQTPDGKAPAPVQRLP